MDLWRRAADPWGQDVLIGVSWDLMWAAIIVAAAFLVGTLRVDQDSPE